ncbi:MAG: hypothetical protein E6192_04365 [Finegoldia magna]|uniref:Uncharacterized protein n=1 Tax=Finegoldia magna TaxID=1260 RepID=A0A233VJG8_FINMA|nr:hypothetical protein [Finegoldia magna]MDU1399097.1 hypothetical protein [Finegoldia magna]MDU5224332.1 hypothetical protein [Finegoldia magna]MDU5236763.1 hypothetical protein [Finegoldia magna]MDU7385092.1 hypothetical protein [Finegoldia magna]OXZ32556.1 hypothetical protein B9N55_04810 [Finegoldia magna]
MKSILSVVWKYKGFTFLFFVFVALLMIIVHFLHNKLQNKQKKYIFTTAIFILSAVLFVMSMLSILSKFGLTLLMMFTFTFASAVICLAYSLILDIIKPISEKKKSLEFRNIIEKFDRLVEESRSTK